MRVLIFALTGAATVAQPVMGQAKNETCQAMLTHAAAVSAQIDWQAKERADLCSAGPTGDWTLMQQNQWLQRREKERDYYNYGTGQKPFTDIPDRKDTSSPTLTVNQANSAANANRERAGPWAGCNALITDEQLALAGDWRTINSSMIKNSVPSCHHAAGVLNLPPADLEAFQRKYNPRILTADEYTLMEATERAATASRLNPPHPKPLKRIRLPGF